MQKRSDLKKLKIEEIGYRASRFCPDFSTILRGGARTQGERTGSRSREELVCDLNH